MPALLTGPRKSKDVYVAVPTGIGDFSWCWSKLQHLGYNVHVVAPGGNPRRLEPFVRLLPGVSSFCYRDDINTKDVLDNGNWGGDEDGFLSSEDGFLLALNQGKGTKEHPLPFQLNTHLEHGHGMSSYLPYLPTFFHYEIHTSKQDEATARARLFSETGFLAVYMSSISMNNRWNGWTPIQWTRLIDQLIPDVFPRYVLVGAQWDQDMSKYVSRATRSPCYANLVGELKFGATLSVLRSAAYLVGFPSGVPIVSYVDRSCPTLMLYPEHLDKMRGTWNAQGDYDNGWFQDSLFCPVRKAVEMVKSQIHLYASKKRDYGGTA